MNKYNINRLKKALLLERNIVGVKFIAYKEEWYAYDAKSLDDKKTTFCSIVRYGLEGEVVKANSNNFRCRGGAQSLGIIDKPEAIKSGRVYKACGLYKSHSIARQVLEGMTHIGHKIYGVVVGPLEKIEEADTVIILGNAKQMMRIIQGYTYEYGVCKNLSTVGNQAMCSDLVSKPFRNNDLNLSLLCCGARIFSHADDGEMGVGFPIQMFNPIANGVLETLNVTESPKSKKKILENISGPEELDIDIDMETSYGKNAAAYEEYTEEVLRRERNS